jgi:hypothetical protein
MMIISHLYLFHCSRMHRTATRAESIYRREYEKLWWDEEEFCDSKLLHLRWLLKSSPCLKYSESTFSHCNFWEEARPINDTFFWVTWDPWTIIHTISSDHETGGAGAQAVHGSCYWESACRIGQCPSMRILWLRYCEVLIACAQDASLSRSVICFRLGIFFRLFSFSAARPVFDLSPSAIRQIAFQCQVTSIRNYCLINIFLVSFIYAPHYMMASFYCSKQHIYTVHGQ